MQKDHVSELVCAQTRPAKLSVLASNGQAAPPAFVVVSFTPCVSPTPPHTAPPRSADRNGHLGLGYVMRIV